MLLLCFTCWYKYNNWYLFLQCICFMIFIVISIWSYELWMCAYVFLSIEYTISNHIIFNIQIYALHTYYLVITSKLCPSSSPPFTLRSRVHRWIILAIVKCCWASRTGTLNTNILSLSSMQQSMISSYDRQAVATSSNVC